MISYDGPINILLVDDYPENLLAIDAVLGDLNYNLVKCLSGEEALRALLKDDFAVIVMDVQMPGMDGFETARMIKSRDKTKEIPIIFVSATSKEAQHLFTGYAVGAIDYMLKPFVPHIFRSKIEGFVRMYIGNKTLQMQTLLLQQQTQELERMNKMLMRTAQQLTRSEAVKSVISRTSMDTMITFDQNGIILTVNPSVLPMFRYQEKDVIGLRINELIPNLCVEQLDRMSEGMMDGGSPGRLIEVMPRRRDNSSFQAEIKLGSTHIDDELIFACTVSDISERKRAEREILAAKEAAEVADRAKTEFLAMVSHEIRTPMNGILGMTNLIMETELNGEQKDFAEIILKSGNTLLSVINDILDYAKIEARKLELELVPFDLTSCVDESLDLFIAKSRESNIEINCELSPDIPEYLYGDATKLRQILINLVSNAIKFTSEGQIDVRARLVLDEAAADQGDEDDVRIEFEISDTGVGIPTDKLDLLFQPFSQLDSSMSRKYGGTGLGLAICKNLVELMGGSIVANANEPRGAKFTFSVKLKRNDMTTGAAEIAAGTAAEHAPQWTSALPHSAAFSFSDMLNGFSEASIASSINKDSMVTERTVTGSVETESMATDSMLFKLPIQQGRSPMQGGNGWRVLVAEDNDVNQKLILKLLGKLGIQPDVAENGEAAVGMARMRGYDMILMDMKMPVMDGLEATRIITSQSSQRAIPAIIAMTANVLPGDKQRCLEAGMSDYISKPIRLDMLQQIISRYLTGDRAAGIQSTS